MLAIYTELALLVITGRRQHHSRRQIDQGAKAPAAQGRVFHKPVADGSATKSIVP